MAASETRSSARVSPRSVIVVAAISATTSESVAAVERTALVQEVDRRDLEVLARDVLPHVELGPVGDGEHADVLAAADAAVVEVPQLGALVARVPLPEVVAEGEDPLLGPRALLVAAGAAPS